MKKENQNKIKPDVTERYKRPSQDEYDTKAMFAIQYLKENIRRLDDRNNS